MKLMINFIQIFNLFKVYSRALATSQGNCIVSPATNLNVSDRVMNNGSCFPILCVLAASVKKMNKQNSFYFYLKKKTG